MGNATSIFNLMRNVGASIGISTVEAMQVRRTQTHLNVLTQHVTASNPQTQRILDNMTALFVARGAGPAVAAKQAHAAVWAMVVQQATMLSYNDVFFFMAMMFLAMFPLIFLMRRPKAKASPQMAH
jgi:DHA2 family multidrug resistance protein